MLPKHLAGAAIAAILLLLQGPLESSAATIKDGPPAAAAPAARASFDCGKAASTQEKLICATPGLSALDVAVADAYRSVLGKLDGVPKTAFRESQREWITYRQTICPAAQPEPGSHPPAECLKHIYQERLESLSKALQSVGPYTFLRIHRARASIGEDEDGRATFSSVDVEMPTIIAPTGVNADRFNAEMKEWAGRYMAPPKDTSEFDDDTDYFGDTIIQHADETLICVQFFDGSNSHGSAHGSTAITAVNWLWREGRALRVEDLFKPRSGWQEALAKLAFGELKKLVEDDLTTKEAGELLATAEDPKNWIVTPDEFSIQFGQYEVGPYAIGTPTANIPWSALGSFLVGSPPLKIRY
jgi:uncharacterized protein YecT (DUF1311 family)